MHRRHISLLYITNSETQARLPPWETQLMLSMFIALVLITIVLYKPDPTKAYIPLSLAPVMSLPWI
jgi:hypothetical protein